MKILIIIGILALIVFSIWYAKRNGITAEYKSESKKKLTEKDSPIDFGNKIVWIAVKTNNTSTLMEVLGFKNSEPANWESGIENAYENSVYLTPQIGEWTLAVGMGLPLGDSLESIEQLEELLNELSSKFGEAHFFGTHRVAEYHNWMRSVNGKIERIYAYIGESEKNIKVFGQPTEPERDLKLFNSLSQEAKFDNYSQRKDLHYPNEELVMKIAENWSINPTKLSKRADIMDELGIVLE